MRRIGTLVLIGVLTSGCYHAVVETGRPAGTTTIDKAWAHGFLWGLVPPSTVETAQKCPSGVAKVETQMSFLNMFANFLTSGLYSPMQITVTCAQGGTADARTINGKNIPPREAIAQAAEMAARAGAAAFVAFR